MTIMNAELEFHGYALRTGQKTIRLPGVSVATGTVGSSHRTICVLWLLLFRTIRRVRVDWLEGKMNLVHL